MIEGDLPPVINWSAGPHLVFAFHNHSGMVFATQLGADDPLTFCGFDDDPEPILNKDCPAEVFTAWVFGAVDGHEARLDYWQSVYEMCRHNPTEAQRLGSVQWVRSIPGMAQRLG